jgi:uncharacterized cupin superfamily protein
MGDPTRIIVLERNRPGEASDPSPEKILAGIPHGRVSNQFSDASAQFHCGWWSSTPGKWRVRYAENEFCVIVDGRVRIESAAGERHEFKAGDAFVVPAGFEGTWEVLAACRKWYAIFEPRSTA